MSKIKFTPGPWDYGITRTDNLIDAACVAAFVDGDDVHICELFDPGSFAQWEANVHLIVSAPDLYALVKEARSFLGHIANTLEQKRWLSEADAALAKADGASQ